MERVDGRILDLVNNKGMDIMGGCDFQNMRFSVPMSGDNIYDKNYNNIFRKKKKKRKPKKSIMTTILIRKVG